MHERLKNPTDNLSHSVKLFTYQHDLFQAQLPSSVELGLLQLDSKECRETLLPTPKEMLASVEEIVPSVIRERTDTCKKWL